VGRLVINKNYNNAEKNFAMLNLGNSRLHIIKLMSYPGHQLP
jgi:hypothetical protein